MTFDTNHLILAQTAEQSPAAAGDPAAGDSAAKTGSPLGPWPIFILMFVIMYFLMIRPNQKRAKEQKQRVESLKKGSKVISAGGIHGLVTNVSDKTVTVKVSDNAKIRFEKASITQVFGGKDDTDEDSGDDTDADEADDDTDSSDEDKA